MGERRSRPSTELTYSEADLAEFRQEWDRSQKEQQWMTQLAQMSGRLDALPELIKSTARQITLEVLRDQKTAEGEHAVEAARNRRSDLRLAFAGLAVVVLVIVPFEDALLRVIIR